MDDRTVKLALERHWAASDANDFKAEHEIYRDDAVLDYPQSGERIRGRHNIQESRFVQPNKKRFTVRRIIGGGDLWVTEFVLTYDGIPSYAVSIMEFREGLVANETQYFADRFDPAPSRTSCRAHSPLQLTLLICPTGCLALPLSSPLRKNFSLRRALETALLIRHPVPPEGRIAIVTDVGHGMRWTLAALLTRARACGRRSRVVLTPRRWRSSLAEVTA